MATDIEPVEARKIYFSGVASGRPCSSWTDTEPVDVRSLATPEPSPTKAASPEDGNARREKYHARACAPPASVDELLDAADEAEDLEVLRQEQITASILSMVKIC